MGDINNLFRSAVLSYFASAPPSAATQTVLKPSVNIVHQSESNSCTHDLQHTEHSPASDSYDSSSGACSSPVKSASDKHGIAEHEDDDVPIQCDSRPLRKRMT